MSASAPGSTIERTKAAMRPSSPRSSRISSTTARYSRSSSRMRPSTVSSSGALLDIDEQAALAVGGCRARNGAVQALEGDRASTAGEPDAVGDLGDGSDACVLVVVLGHEQHPLLVADVDGEGDVHVGEDHEVLQGYEQQTGVLAQRFSLSFGGRTWSEKCSDRGTVSRGACGSGRARSRRRGRRANRSPARHRLRSTS